MDQSNLQEIGLQTLSRSTSPPGTIPHPEPEKNHSRAWLKVLGCFLVFVKTWGLASSFGAYQAYYETDLLSTYSPSAISWIGTTQVFLLGFTGILAGPLHDRGHVRILLSIGCSLVVFGLFMLSLSTEYYQILLSQGACIGIGSGLTYVPAVSVVSNSYTKRRSFAMGLAASGSAVGSAVLTIMFRQLLPRVGFGWINRIFGISILAISIAATAVLRSDAPPTPSHSTFFNAKALKEPAFVMLCAGLFFVELGFWIPPFFLAPYAQFSLQTSANFASYLLAIMNASGFAGRILPALVAQAFGPAWVLVGGCVCLGVLVLSWLGIHDIPGITVWSVLVGFMSGITVSLPNAVVPRLSVKAVVGARTGMMWSFVAFAALIGSPIAGLLIDPDKGDYRNGEIFSGVSICLGAALLCGPAIYVTKDERKDE